MKILISLLIFITSQTVQAVSVVKEKVAPLSNEPVGPGSYLQMFFGLFIVVALIFGMAWFMRRMGNMRGMTKGDLQILGGLSVGQRERIVLVQAGKTQLLVGVAPGSIRTLHVLDDIISDDDVNIEPVPSFAEKLHAAISIRKRKNNEEK